jgi:penicillin-binding protein activator
MQIAQITKSAKYILIGAALVIGASTLSGCAGKKVTRVASDSQIDLSGKWNDTDSRLVAKEMIEDCLARPWYQQILDKKQSVPTIVVGSIKNKSHEHINVETFIKDMERNLINSGKVEFVAGKEVREELRDEIASQAGNASADTRKEMGQETGADLLLVGTISSIIDQEDNKAVVFYQVDLELIDVQSHRKLWIGDKKIKKFIERGKVKP